MEKEIEVNLPEEGSVVQDESATVETEDLDAAAKAQELMNLISELEVLRSYRKARHAGERRQVTKEEKKKKKAKRRMAKKSRR
jgi:hypothetical protein